MDETKSMSKKDYQWQLRNGWKPDQDYVFVSYSSRDWDKVYPCVMAMRARGINVYIDIEFMENQSASWLSNFQDRLFLGSGCKGIVAFLSVDYMRSYACLMEQMANRTNKMRKRMGKPLPVFYVALDPALGTLQQMSSYIYDDAVRRESARERVEMSPPEYLALQKFILDSRLEDYRDADSVRDLLDGIHDKHDVVTTMYELIFASSADMPNIQEFESVEQCAQLLTDNFINDKNASIKIAVLEDLKRETMEKLGQFAPAEQTAEEKENEGQGLVDFQQTEEPPSLLEKEGPEQEPDWREELRSKEEEQRRLEEERRQEPLQNSIEELTARAEEGDALAQNDLGLRYAKGDGVAQDWNKAFDWYQKSACQGCIYGLYNLAWRYYNGQGTEQSLTKAAELFRQAAEQGYDEAQCMLGVCCANGEGTAQDWVQAAYWYREAAEQGNAAAQYNLAWRYYRGQGVEQNPEQAVYWFQQAAEQG